MNNLSCLGGASFVRIAERHSFGEPMYNDIVEEMDCIDSRMYIRIGLVLE